MTITSSTCVRAVWLTMGSQSVLLDNPAGGYFVTSLDLGSPDVRSVTYARPDTDGLVDLTQYMGGRVVSVDIQVLSGAGARIDDVADNFAPFMVPSARPTLHYVLDRPGTPERTLMLRGSAYSVKFAGDYERDLSLQFQAADPICRDPALQVATAWSGSSSRVGRTYNLSFPRVYPAGGGAAVNSTITTPGDVAVKPIVRIYGPITQPQVSVALQAAQVACRLYFVPGFRIDVGHRVDIDCANHTAYLDGDATQSVLSSLDVNYMYGGAGGSKGWPVIGPAPEVGTLSLAGSSTSAATQCSAEWHDGYLS